MAGWTCKLIRLIPDFVGLARSVSGRVFGGVFYAPWDAGHRVHLNPPLTLREQGPLSHRVKAQSLPGPALVGRTFHTSIKFHSGTGQRCAGERYLRGSAMHGPRDPNHSKFFLSLKRRIIPRWLSLFLFFASANSRAQKTAMRSYSRAAGGSADCFH